MKKSSVSTSISIPQRTLKDLTGKSFLLRWVVPAILLAAIIVFGFYIISRSLDNSSALGNGSMPVNPLIEEKLGIRVTQVAISADNGLLDLRYQVLDPSKAEQVMSEPENLPYLIPENGKGEIRYSLSMPHHEKIVAGRTYYLLFYNSGGIVKTGDFVTVALGDLRLEHVPVK